MEKIKKSVIGPQTSVCVLPGVGTQRAQALKKLGIFTAGDLLYHFPRGYQHRGDVRPLCGTADGETASFLLTVSTMPITARLRGRMTLTKFSAVDEDGTRCVISYFNQSYMQDRFAVGMAFRFYGKIGSKNGYRTLFSPACEPYGSEITLPDFYPVYPLAAGISQRLMQGWMASLLQALPQSAPPDPLPEEILREYALPSMDEALRMVHRPQDFEEVRRGRDRFVFEQILTFALGVSIAKQYRKSGTAQRMRLSAQERCAFYAALPYRLTGAQERAVAEIEKDLLGEKEDCPEGANNRRDDNIGKDVNSRKDGNEALCVPMNRMLSGDVGSGKTVCAAYAAYVTLCSGMQCALIAPTEILAQQHYHDLSVLFSAFGKACCLLTGSTSAAEKRAIRAGLADGTVPFVIGTHALLSESVAFAHLGLVITDEQHRFGVMQRATLSRRSEEAGSRMPHMLVMSATPIPRSLMLVLYGDLSLSVLDELPPGRQRIDTCVVDESYRERVNRFLARQVAEGHQAYVVCPAVDAGEGNGKENGNREGEENEDALVAFEAQSPTVTHGNPMHSVVTYAPQLQKALPQVRIATLHGRMKSGEKEKIMAAFACNEVQILVSTTVIEVGVNVPNATLMVVENAERFGLSQLHQLRGRVGRGSAKSYCVLVSDAQGETAQARLEAMRETNDGYTIAERDLALRGPGDFFPSESGEAQQHGKFALAGLCDNLEEMHRAFAVADLILQKDPDLEQPRNAALRSAVEHLYRARSGTMN